MWEQQKHLFHHNTPDTLTILNTISYQLSVNGKQNPHINLCYHFVADDFQYSLPLNILIHKRMDAKFGVKL